MVLVVDPLERPDNVVFGRKRALGIDDPAAVGTRNEGIEHHPNPIRRVRVTEPRFVEQAPRMGAHAQ
jgi:hypothetical protein